MRQLSKREVRRVNGVIIFLLTGTIYVAMEVGFAGLTLRCDIAQGEAKYDFAPSRERTATTCASSPSSCS